MDENKEDKCENILGLIVIGKFKEGKEDDLSSFEVDDFYAVNNKNFEYVITDKDKTKSPSKRKDTRLIEYFSLFHKKYEITEIDSTDDIASMHRFKNKELKDGQVMLFINAVVRNKKVIVAYKNNFSGNARFFNFNKKEGSNENEIAKIIMNCIENDILNIIRETIKNEKPEKLKEIMDKVLTGNSEEEMIKIYISQRLKAATDVMQVLDYNEYERMQKFEENLNITNKVLNDSVNNFQEITGKKFENLSEDEKSQNIKRILYTEQIKTPSDFRRFNRGIRQNEQEPTINTKYIWNGLIFVGNKYIKNVRDKKTITETYRTLIKELVVEEILKYKILNFETIKKIIKDKFILVTNDGDTNPYKAEYKTFFQEKKMNFGGKTRKKKKRTRRNKKTKTIKQLLKRFLYQ